MVVFEGALEVFLGGVVGGEVAGGAGEEVGAVCAQGEHGLVYGLRFFGSSGRLASRMERTRKETERRSARAVALRRARRSALMEIPRWSQRVGVGVFIYD